VRTILLFVITAVAEIIGCYLALLVARDGRSPWLLAGAAAALALFAWLLTLHPIPSGRLYAAYGCVYVAIALVWLQLVDGVRLTAWDIAGAAIALVGMTLIVFQPRV